MVPVDSGAVCCSVLQCVAVCCSVLQCASDVVPMDSDASLLLAHLMLQILKNIAEAILFHKRRIHIKRDRQKRPIKETNKMGL